MIWWSKMVWEFWNLVAKIYSIEIIDVAYSKKMRLSAFRGNSGNSREFVCYGLGRVLFGARGTDSCQTWKIPDPLTYFSAKRPFRPLLQLLLSQIIFAIPEILLDFRKSLQNSSKTTRKIYWRWFKIFSWNQRSRALFTSKLMIDVKHFRKFLQNKAECWVETTKIATQLIKSGDSGKIWFRNPQSGRHVEFVRLRWPQT